MVYKGRAKEILSYITKSPKTAVPNLFGTRGRFRGRQFFHGLGWGGMVHTVMQAMVQAVMRAIGNGR